MPSADEQPLLTYLVDTMPSPLQAGRSGTLRVVASNLSPSQTITCYSISIIVSVGPTAADLTTTVQGIETPRPGPQWTARFEGPTYTATANGEAGLPIVAEGIPLLLQSIAVNDRIGATTIFIDEDAKTASGERRLRSLEIVLPKFPAQFTLSNLTVAPDTVQNGGSAVLMWTGTNLPGLATYKLSWVAGGQRREDDVAWIGPRTVPGIDTEPNTVFTLQANVAGLPEPVTRTAIVNVIPRLPVIERFTGHIEGRQIRLSWKALDAESCFIDSMKFDATGQVVLPLDRVCYVLTARSRTRNVRAMLVLQFTSRATARIPAMLVRGNPVDRELGLAVSSNASSLVLFRNAFGGCVLLDGVTLAERNVLIPGGGYLSAVAVAAISSDRRYLFASVSALGRSEARMFDEHAQVIRMQDAGATVAAAFSHGDEWLYVVTDNSPRFGLHKFAVRTFEKETEMAFDGSMGHAPSAMCTSPSGDRVFAAGPGGVFAIDVNDQTMIAEHWSDVRIGCRAAFCWRNDEDLRLALDRDTGGEVRDAKTLKTIRRDPGWGRFVMSATELLVCPKNEYGLNVVDRATLSRLVTLPIETRSDQWFNNSSSVAFAAGVLYVGIFTGKGQDLYSELTRYAATSAIRVAPALAVDVLKGEGTLVAVVAATEPVTMTMEGDDVVAEAPPGWRVTREGQNFTFTPEEGAAESETVAFTFRGVAEEAEVRIEEAAG